MVIHSDKMTTKRALDTASKFQGLLEGGYITHAGGMTRTARVLAAVRRMPVSEQLERAKAALSNMSSPMGISFQEMRVEKLVDTLERKAARRQ